MAVFSVLIYHTVSTFLPGGFVGVDVFFVLSGFVITRSLLAEASQAPIDVRLFFARRFWRLTPALVTMVAVAATMNLVYNVEHWGLFFGEAASALTYSYNLLQTALGGRGGFLAHTWSLGIEEQFYLMWAPVLAWLLRTQPFRSHTRIVVIAIGCLILGES